jgi:hypothetical protein
MKVPETGWGPWTFQEYIGGNRGSGETNKFRDSIHGSVNPVKARRGKVFSLVVEHTDAFGFNYHSVPNACIIP